jgi:hypothetical protein
MGYIPPGSRTELLSDVPASHLRGLNVQEICVKGEMQTLYGITASKVGREAQRASSVVLYFQGSSFSMALDDYRHETGPDDIMFYYTRKRRKRSASLTSFSVPSFGYHSQTSILEKHCYGWSQPAHRLYLPTNVLEVQRYTKSPQPIHFDIRLPPRSRSHALQLP